MIERNTDVKQRKAYGKPYIEQVRLVSQESVLAVCKFTVATDPDGTGVNCVVSNCLLDNGAS